MKNLRTFRARTMAEALDQVKRHFGRDAVILHTKAYKDGGVAGIGAHRVVEITAAPQPCAPESPAASTQVTGGLRAGPSAPSAAPPEPTAARLLDEVNALKTIIEEMASRARRAEFSNLPAPYADTYVHLVQKRVAESIAAQLVERMRSDLGTRAPLDPATVRAYLARTIETMLPVAGPIRLARTSPTVIALVGPTGVGKTTTIAKLAANFSLREHKSVGLVTIDTYRIAAVEQLRAYADIIKVPIEVVMSPDRLPQAIHRMRDRDLILIDTAGRSQNDRTRLGELKQFLDSAKPHEVHLVLSSTCCQDVLLDTIERYRDMGVNRVVFTKLDEAVGFGAILNGVTKAQAGVSYVTTGQRVPDDIEVGRGNRLADLIVKQTRWPVA